MFASVFVLARDAATLKRKRGRRRRRRRKLVRLFVRSLSFDDENKQNTDEEKQAMKILAPKKKNEGGANSKKFSPRRRSDTFLSFSVLTLPLGGAFLAFTTPARAEREEERIKFCQSLCFGKKF